MTTLEALRNELLERWPSAVVARNEVERFSGGLLSPRTLANLDSMGDGLPALRIGRRVVYRASDLADWLLARATVREGGDSWRGRSLRSPAD